jgi:hypothetical protein
MKAVHNDNYTSSLSVLGRDKKVCPTVFSGGGGRHEGLSEVRLGWRQDIGNWSNQESKFDFLATRQCLVKINKGQKLSEGGAGRGRLIGRKRR